MGVALLFLDIGINQSAMAGTFKYFAYGSNLLEKRIRLCNPSAKKVTIGKLMNYRLDFAYWSQRWRGCAATIIPQDNSYVWGVIWDISINDLPDLDRQESVGDGVYEPITVDVEDISGQVISCRSYQLCDLPLYSPQLPPERFPSKIYLDTIIEGAIESKIPDDYIDKLKEIPHNDFNGPVDLLKKN